MIISAQSGRFYRGRVSRIDEGYIILNPHQEVKWDLSGRVTTRFVNEEETVDIGKIEAVTPTTRRNLEIYFELENEDYREEREKKADSKKQDS